jgi:hypothetical protein
VLAQHAAEDANAQEQAVVDDIHLCARRALIRLAEREDAGAEDPWPVVLDRLRLTRRAQTLDAWTESAEARLDGVRAAAPLSALLACLAVVAFGSELVPVEGWATADGRGHDLAFLRLLPRADAAARTRFAEEILAVQRAEAAEAAEQQSQ